MAGLQIATLQPGWDCLWSRAGQGRTANSATSTLERTRICVRGGHHRAVSDAECEQCALWEPLPAEAPHAGARVEARAHHATPLSVAPAAVALPARIAADAVPRLALRGLLLLEAVGMAAVGFILVSDIIWIPVTVAMWLSAAGLAGLAVFWAHD